MSKYIHLTYSISSKEMFCNNCNSTVPKGHLVFLNVKTKEIEYHFPPELYKSMLMAAKDSGTPFGRWFSEATTGLMVQYLSKNLK